MNEFTVVVFILIVSILIVVVNYKAQKYSYNAMIQKRRLKRQDYGYIYFYRGKWENPFRVKIGRTNSWKNRLKSARTSVSPHGILILGAVIVKDDKQAENAVFTHFSDERIRSDKRNEWFKLSFRLWLFIRMVRDKSVTHEAKAQLEF